MGIVVSHTKTPTALQLLYFVAAFAVLVLLVGARIPCTHSRFMRITKNICVLNGTTEFESFPSRLDRISSTGIHLQEKILSSLFIADQHALTVHCAALVRFDWYPIDQKCRRDFDLEGWS